MSVSLTGISGNVYEFERERFSLTDHPQFAVAGILAFAKQNEAEFEIKYIAESINIWTLLKTSGLLGLAVDRHQCNAILWRQGPPGNRERRIVLNDLVAVYLPPMNDDLPSS